MIRRTLFLFLIAFLCFYTYADNESPPGFSIYLLKIIKNGAPAPVGSTISIFSSDREIASQKISISGFAGLFTLYNISDGDKLEFFLDGERLRIKKGDPFFHADSMLHKLFLFTGKLDRTLPIIKKAEFIKDKSVKILFSETIEIFSKIDKLFVCSESVASIKWLSKKNGFIINFSSISSNYVQIDIKGKIKDISGNPYNGNKTIIIKK